MKVIVETRYKGRIEREVASYLEATNYVEELKIQGIDVMEYTVVLADGRLVLPHEGAVESENLNDIFAVTSLYFDSTSLQELLLPGKVTYH